MVWWRRWAGPGFLGIRCVGALPEGAMASKAEDVAECFQRRRPIPPGDFGRLKRKHRRLAVNDRLGLDPYSLRTADGLVNWPKDRGLTTKPSPSFCRPGGGPVPAPGRRSDRPGDMMIGRVGAIREATR